MKVTGKWVALSSALIGLIIIAVVSRDWIFEKFPGLRTEEPWVKGIRNTLDHTMITASYTKRPLNQVLPSLSEMTGVKFVIDPAIDAQARTVTLQAKDMKGIDLLNDAMAQTGLSYDFRDNGIYIKERAGGR